MPIYRAAHRHPSPTSIRLRQPMLRKPVTTLGEELARPEVLSAAITQGQMRLFYHPIVHLAGTSVVGHEVLLRWQHPDHGLLDPASFLPAIDSDAALSSQLGTWVLQQACAAAISRGEQLHVSVNISPLHLAEPGFVDSVVQLLRATGFAPSHLILELSESSVRDAAPTVVDACVELTGLGVTLALDDLLTIAADDALLSTLPLGILKIDRTVTAGIGSDPQAEALILSTLETARAAGLRTIAVGVESHDQAQFLRRNDATYAQGYLYGRPKPR